MPRVRRRYAQYGAYDDILTYEGQSRTIETLGWWCIEFGEAIFSGEPLLARAQAFQRFKSEVDAASRPSTANAATTGLST